MSTKYPITPAPKHKIIEKRLPKLSVSIPMIGRPTRVPIKGIFFAISPIC